MLGPSPILGRAPAARMSHGDLARYALAEYRTADPTWLVREAREARRAANGSDECQEDRAVRMPTVRRLARTLASVFL